MTLLLLALLAVATGLALDARRQLSAERERYGTEVTLARLGWHAANARAGEHARLARALAARLREAETVTLVVAPREPSGLYPADADTNPGLRAVGQEDEA